MCQRSFDLDGDGEDLYSFTEVLLKNFGLSSSQIVHEPCPAACRYTLELRDEIYRKQEGLNHEKGKNATRIRSLQRPENARCFLFNLAVETFRGHFCAPVVIFLIWLGRDGMRYVDTKLLFYGGECQFKKIAVNYIASSFKSKTCYALRAPLRAMG
jgi:hypothetical protein